MVPGLLGLEEVDEYGTGINISELIREVRYGSDEEDYGRVLDDSYYDIYNDSGYNAGDDDDETGHQLLTYIVPDNRSLSPLTYAAVNDSSPGIAPDKKKKKPPPPWYRFTCVVDDDVLGDQD